MVKDILGKQTHIRQAIQSGNCASIYSINLKTCLLKNLHANVYRSFIHNCQKLEATKISFTSWIDKFGYIHASEY